MLRDGQTEQCIHEYFSSIGVIFSVTTFYILKFVCSQHSFLRDFLTDQRQRWALSFKMSIKFHYYIVHIRRPGNVTRFRISVVPSHTLTQSRTPSFSTIRKQISVLSWLSVSSLFHTGSFCSFYADIVRRRISSWHWRLILLVCFRGRLAFFGLTLGLFAISSGS